LYLINSKEGSVVVGPALAVDLVPKSATSQAARDKLNAETSALPGLKDTFTPGVDANAVAAELTDVPSEAKKVIWVPLAC